MRRRIFPNMIGDVIELDERQERLERVMQIFGITPEYPYTVNINDGTRNRVLLGKINGDYGIKIVDNAGNEVILANGTIVANAIKTGTLDCDLITVIHLDAGSITTGYFEATRIQGGTLNCGTMTVINLSAGSITVGTFLSINDRLTAQAIHGDKIQVGTLNADRIVAFSIQADKIASNAISTDKLQSGSVIASKISVTELAAISSKMGILYAGGSGNGDGRIYVRDAGGSTIIDMYNGGLFSWRPIVSMNQQGFHAVGTGVDIATYIATSGGACYLFPDDSDTRLLFRGRTIQFYDSGGTNKLDFNKGSSQIYDDGNLKIVTDDHIYLNCGNAIRPNRNIVFEGGERSIENIDWLVGYNDLQLKVQGGNRIFFDSSEDGNDLSMYPKWGDFYATGHKYFRIKHPDHPDEGWIQYVSVEAPEPALKTRGIAKLVNGKVTITLPRHWELVTEDYLTTAQLTPLEDCKGLFAPKADLKNTSFVVKELQGGNSNAEFMWELTATRKDGSNFNPEQTVEEEVEKHAQALVNSQIEKETKEQFTARRQKKIDEQENFRVNVLKRFKEIKGRNYIDKVRLWRDEGLTERSEAIQAKRKFQRAVSDEEHERVNAVIVEGKQTATAARLHVEQLDKLAEKYQDYTRAVREINNIN